MIFLYVVFLVLIVAVLIAFVLIQNPKGGGLSAGLAGFNAQFLGVQRTTDVLEKGTWILSILLLLLCLGSAWFIPKDRSDSPGQSFNQQEELFNNMNLNPDLPVKPNTTLPLEQPPKTDAGQKTTPKK